jgi:adenylate cyclase
MRSAGKFGDPAAALVRLGRHAGPFLIGTVVGLFSLTLYIFTYVDPRPGFAYDLIRDIEAKTLDARFRLRGSRTPGAPLVIIAIDEKSEDVLGRWPFPRSVFANMLDFLREAGARVVTFDINFPQPDENSALVAIRKLKQDYSSSKGPRNPRYEAKLRELELEADNDGKLAEAISRNSNAILGYYCDFEPQEAGIQDTNRRVTDEFLNYLSFQAYPQVFKPSKGARFNGLEALAISPNLPRFVEGAKNFGFFNVVPDSDGTVRSQPVVMRFRQSFYPSLDIATVLAYMNQPLEKVAVVFGESGLVRVDLGSVRVPTDPEGMVRIDFHGASKTYPTYSLADVVQHRLSLELFRDRIVLVGPTATGIADTRPTPFEKASFPGVEVHANFIDNLLTGSFIRRGPRQTALDMFFLALFSLPAGILIGVLRPLRSALLVLLTGTSFVILNYYQFAFHRTWLLLFLPVATLLTTYAAIVSWRYFFEEREKKLVRNAFQQYMSPEVITQVLDRPELLRLGGEERELTAMFADIRGFTALSEGLGPADLVQLLNEYLSEMTAVVFEYRGTLDKYIGDAIMAFWGAPLLAPNHAELACRAALGMSDALEKLRSRWAKSGRPQINIGVGINTGTMLVGNMGSERRFNYTIIGDNVNVASRLEGVTKTFGTRLLISESTREAVGAKMAVRELDLIRVKGKHKPLTIFELLGPIEEYARYQDLVSGFEDALAFYRRRDWEPAMRRFQDLGREFPHDAPTQVMIARCAALAEEPPDADWDGVYAMQTK